MPQKTHSTRRVQRVRDCYSVRFKWAWQLNSSEIPPFFALSQAQPITVNHHKSIAFQNSLVLTLTQAHAITVSASSLIVSPMQTKRVESVANLPSVLACTLMQYGSIYQNLQSSKMGCPSVCVGVTSRTEQRGSYTPTQKLNRRPSPTTGALYKNIPILQSGFWPPPTALGRGFDCCIGINRGLSKLLALTPSFQKSREGPKKIFQFLFKVGSGLSASCQDCLPTVKRLDRHGQCKC